MSKASKKKKGPGGPPEIRNSKARHSYLLGDHYEAGIKLTGTEVKSIRLGKAQISESFCRVDREGAIWLHNAHIQEYAYGTDANHAPTRTRLLLLNKKEIRRIRQEMEAGGQALIPLRLYFKEALIKCEIALAKSKNLHDKRETLRQRDDLREAQRAMTYRR